MNVQYEPLKYWVAQVQQVVPQYAQESPVEYLHFLYSLTRYTLVAPFVGEKRVLDIGCGEGHGSAILAEHAETVVGVDISIDLVSKATITWSGPRVTFAAMNAENLGFCTGCFDVVLACEVIEHVSDVRGFVGELARVVAPKGVCFITTPNKRLRLLPLQKPWNPEHLREYHRFELEKLLRGAFAEVVVGGIFGVGPVHEFFVNRWRQSPLRVYAKMFLPHFLVRAAKAAISRTQWEPDNRAGARDGANSLPALKQAWSAPVETLPFVVSQEHLGRALNWFAVCAKDASVASRVSQAIFHEDVK